VIDPGLSKGGGCGWSIWATEAGQLDEPIYAGLLRRVCDGWQDQAYKNTRTLEAFIKNMNCAGVAVEYPSYWASSSRSRIALQSGSLGKLFFQVGQIASLHPNTRLVTVQEWKNKMSKEETKLRTMAALGRGKLVKLLGTKESKWNSDVLDSLGIGLYLKKRGV